MLYFAHVESLNAVKIGYSHNPAKRIRALQTALPVEAILLGTVPGFFKEERRLHKLLSRFHIRGEWYRADQKLLDYVAATIEAQEITEFPKLDKASVVFLQRKYSQE